MYEEAHLVDVDCAGRPSALCRMWGFRRDREHDDLAILGDGDGDGDGNGNGNGDSDSGGEHRGTDDYGSV